MSKELSDIQDLKSAFISHCKTLGCEDNYIKVCKNKYEDIETALKRLETLEEDFMSLTETNMELVQEQARNQKKLKALEIIKEKRVNLEYLKCCDTYEQYCLICSYANEITQEEFDLLKEILKDE